MASPVDAARIGTNVSTAADPITATYPTGIAAGDLLVMYIRVPAATALAAGAPSGWTRLVDGVSTDAADDLNYVLYKVADGSESGTFTIDMAASAKAAVLIWRFTGAGTPSIGPITTGTLGSIDPSGYVPGTTDDFTWLALVGLDGETQSFTAPSGYSNTVAADSGTGGAVATNCRIAGATKATTGTTSENPGAWLHSAPNAGVSAWVMAIPTPSLAKTGSSSVRGGGSIVTAARKGGTSVSTARGGGALSAADRKNALTASSISGGGALASTGQKDSAPAKTGTSAVSGGGSLGATAGKNSSGSSSVRGGGTLTTSDRKNASGTSGVSGGGGSVGTGREGALRLTGVSGGGAIASSTRKNASGASSVRGGGSITSVGTQLIARSGSSSVSGGGRISGTVAASRSATSSIRGGGRITSVGVASELHAGTSRIGGGGAFTTSTRGGHTGDSDLSGGGVITSTPAGAAGLEIRIRSGPIRGNPLLRAGPLRGGAYSPETDAAFFGSPNPRRGSL